MRLPQKFDVGIICCPQCRSTLTVTERDARCSAGHYFDRADGIINFSGAVADDAHSHDKSLVDESCAIRRRTTRYLLPWLESTFAQRLGTIRLLEDGAGSGAQVSAYLDHDIDAYGVDPDLRTKQWHTAGIPEQRMFIADPIRLPFYDYTFDAVTSSGVLQHVGEPRPAGQRSPFQAGYVQEILRVLKPDGVALLAHPKGAHPFDFWHGGRFRSGMRAHLPYERRMPNLRQIRRWAATTPYPHSVRCLTPQGYLDPLLARTWLNPWRITEIHKWPYELLAYPG